MPAASRQSEKQKPRKGKTYPPDSFKGTKRGRPTTYSPRLARKICVIIAEGASFAKALAQLGINERTGYRWASARAEFRQDLLRAREIRGDFTFGEQILDIADDGTNDWIEAKNGGAARVNKEVVLRSKLRIEARRFHMSRLHQQTWGERQQIEVKNDWALLSQEERRRKADEMLQMIRELREPLPQPPPLVYRRNA